MLKNHNHVLNLTYISNLLICVKEDLKMNKKDIIVQSCLVFKANLLSFMYVSYPVMIEYVLPSKHGSCVAN